MKKFIKEAIPYLVIIIAVILIRSYLVTPVIVSGDSMEPTLNDKELLLLNKINYKINKIKLIIINDTSKKMLVFSLIMCYHL